METITIHIADTIGDVFGIDEEDGQKVYELIKKAFEGHNKVLLSFQNIEILTTAFLNIAIGQLYKDFNEEFIREHIAVSDISNSGKAMLKRVVETAKLYYKDRKALERSIDDILGE